jgi:hypothetical protein
MARGKGCILLEAWAIPNSCVFALLAARVLRKFAQSLGRDVLGAFTMKFFRKNGTIFWGEYPPQ